MKKKSILAILMAGLMLATVFSVLSVSAASYSQEQLPARTAGTGTLKVYVYKDLNGNGKQDFGEHGVGGALVSVLYFGDVLPWTASGQASGSGLATIRLKIYYTGYVTVWSVRAFKDNWIGNDKSLLSVSRGETKTIFIGLQETESISEPSQITSSRTTVMA